MPSGDQEALPISSLCSGRPNRMIVRIPSAKASRAVSTILSTECWKTPGIELTGLATPSPGTTNSGSTRLSGERRVSRTSRRRAGVWRKRRSRVAGKLMTTGFYRAGGGKATPHGVGKDQKDIKDPKDSKANGVWSLLSLSSLLSLYRLLPRSEDRRVGK